MPAISPDDLRELISRPVRDVTVRIKAAPYQSNSAAPSSAKAAPLRDPRRVVIQRQLGNRNFGITSRRLPGSENAEIIGNVHGGRAPIPVNT